MLNSSLGKFPATKDGRWEKREVLIKQQWVNDFCKKRRFPLAIKPEEFYFSPKAKIIYITPPTDASQKIR